MKKLLTLLILLITLILLFGCTESNEEDELANISTKEKGVLNVTIPIQDPCQITLEEYGDSVKDLFEKDKLIITKSGNGFDEHLPGSCNLMYKNAYDMMIPFITIYFKNNGPTFECENYLENKDVFCELILDGSIGNSAKFTGSKLTSSNSSYNNKILQVKSNEFNFEVHYNGFSALKKPDENLTNIVIKNIGKYVANNVKKLDPKNESKNYTLTNFISQKDMCNEELENKLKTVYPMIEKIKPQGLLEGTGGCEYHSAGFEKSFNLMYFYYINQENALLEFDKELNEYVKVDNLGDQAVFTKNYQGARILKDNIVINLIIRDEGNTSKEDLTKASEIILEALTTK